MSALRASEVQPGRRKRLHMIGNAHLDVTWLWPCWEGFAAAHATFRSALDRMVEFPEFQFSASSAAYYEWVERNDPKMFEEIKQRVSEGRWHLVGGWWVEPDCNIPGGEGLVRQALTGQRYFETRFGRIAEVGYNVDSFGHPASLPQILKQSGLASYVFMRPQPHERSLPARLFQWESADGSRVQAFRVPFEYCSSGDDLAPHIERCAEDLRESSATSMCFFGVGNHGGGPTIANIETIRRLSQDSDLEMIFSSPAEFFRDVEGERVLPIVRDELQHHAVGCYAAHSDVKRWNRKTENLLLAAEKFSALARKVSGLAYPADLDRAWKAVLLNQFHDVLAGTSLEAAYDDARDGYGEARAIAGQALHQAVQAIALKIDIPMADGSTPIVVFNPHAWSYRAPVELETDGLQHATEVADEHGALTPLQTIQSEATVGPWRRRIVFTAEVPPMGYRVFRPHKGEEQPAAGQSDEAGTLETARWKLQVDAASGFVRSLYDKGARCEVLTAPGGRPVVIADESDTWGHNVNRFQREVGTFQVRRIRLVENGPVRSVLRVESAFQSSRLSQDFIAYRELDGIEVRVRVDWHERHLALKLRWPVNVRMARPTYEIPYGTIERDPNGDEEPGQSWFDVTGIHEKTSETYGLSILNDGKNSFDVRGSEMSMTVLRSPAYAHHDPFRPTDWDDISFTDQGVQSFTYVLLPHLGAWREAETAQRAAELNQPPVAMLDTFHAGPLQPAWSFVEATPRTIAVTALKAAEDGSGDTILRCYETSGLATRARILLSAFDQVIETSFRPHEIKTYRIGTTVSSANLLECFE